MSSEYMSSGRSVDVPIVSARTHSAGARAITIDCGACATVSDGAARPGGHVQYGDGCATMSCLPAGSACRSAVYAPGCPTLPNIRTVVRTSTSTAMSNAVTAGSCESLTVSVTSASPELARLNEVEATGGGGRTRITNATMTCSMGTSKTIVPPI